MENIVRKRNWFFKNISVWVLVLTALVCAGMEALKITQKLDYRFYDGMLAAGHNPKADDKIVLLDIGDESINVYGEWPWTRDILGEVLIRMKELGARDAVFDIEYLMESKPGPVRNTDVDKVSSDLFRNGQDILVDVFEQYKDYLRDGA
ncbi:MAG: CHASE2 domain-containing protein, partial [Treponema sp.]|nr:CHASE2 domain-containing protein [Treponema sp.]